MSGNSDYPIVKRKTVTLDESRVVKDSSFDASLKIVRPQERVSPPINFEREMQTPANRFAPMLQPQQQTRTLREGGTVLVINASLDMARELTVELTTTIPGCNILFAPTLSSALWILKRRGIDIILSSSILPDGPLSKLHEFLELMTPPPELVILSELGTTRSHMGHHPGYRFVELRRLSLINGADSLIDESPAAESKKISALGADLRNDLNNPLQEIVAMAFVAQASQGLSPVAEQALSAIERAADNMATVVSGLEEKIRGAVERSAA